MYSVKDEKKTNSLIRQRSIRLFSYLHELIQLRSKIVKNLDHYDDVLWLSEVSPSNFCYCGINKQSTEVTGSNILLQVTKPRTSALPQIPKILEPWVKPEHYNDFNRDVPELYKRIPNPRHISNNSRVATNEYLYLDDYRAHLIPLWKEFVVKLWQPWAQSSRPSKNTGRIYSQLFSIYQRQQKLGEAFEVVLGIGCLYWKRLNSPLIKRHLLTIPIQLSFDPQKSLISAVIAGEDTSPVLEQDMLTALDHPETQYQKQVKKQFAQIENVLSNIQGIHAILEEWVGHLPVKGEYKESQSLVSATGNNPVISFAPALILRKRAEHNLLNTYAVIIEQLRSGGSIPRCVEQLVTILENPQEKKDSEPAVDVSYEDETLFFPLPANEEQKNIVRRHQQNLGVLVQGPPGTGKSQTIANLICHLLANGKRVLVTSHTARALRILEQKIPKSLSSLCVISLEDDSNSLKKLEDSTIRINESYNKWDPIRNKKLSNMLQDKLNEARYTESRIIHELRALREMEAFHYTISDGTYNGTLQSLAKRLRKERALYTWFPDRPEKELEPPITDDEAVELLNLLRKVGPEEEQILKMRLVKPNCLLTAEAFLKAIEEEKKAKHRYNQFYEIRKGKGYHLLTKQPPMARQQLYKRLSKILDAYDTLDHHAYTWLKKAASDIIAGRTFIWQTLLETTKKHVIYLKKNIDKINDTRITGLANLDLRAVKEHAYQLYLHLLKEGKMGFGPFRPKAVRDALYVTKFILIDGLPCDTPDKLQMLMDYVEILDRIDILGRHWSQHIDIPDKAPLPFQFAEYEALCTPLSQVMELHLDSVELKKIISENPGLMEPHRHDIDSIRKFRTILIAFHAEEQRKSAEQPCKTMGKILQEIVHKPDVHPVIEKLLETVIHRDPVSYNTELQNLNSLNQLRVDFERRNDLLNSMVNVAPLLLKSILLSYDDPEWDRKLASFTAAFNWANAEAWLKRTWGIIDQNDLELEYNLNQQTINDLVKKLCETKAWDHCFSRMTERERQHLLAWTKAVMRIGKGAGKYVNQHRKAAKTHMEKCRTAIPAWVMPIFRVAETIKPSPEMFDVVIIDEASQSGPEALFLQYLAKKIIVVGDDKQISPDFIGVNREEIEILRKKYVRDIPHNDIFSLDNSFFDLAEIRYGQPIRLREHFRCMPEIIEYSNKYFYQTEPLVPLRQFGSSQIKPAIYTRHIDYGFTQESGNRVINTPEAEAIVDQIKECCQDSQYQHKTMGVISLQGISQARYIEKLLLEVIGAEEIEKRNLVCGDPYAFQGDERDIMFISLVAAPDKRIGTLSSAKDARRFNVAISRTKDQVWLFHTATLNDLSPKCLRYSLLKYCLNPGIKMLPVDKINIENIRKLAAMDNRENSSPPIPFDNWFEVDIYLILKNHGLQVRPQVEIDNYYLDLMVEGPHGSLAIECYGDIWRGEEYFAEEINRQQDLERCGWSFWRIRASEYYRNPEETLDKLWRQLNTLGIGPAIQENGYAKITKKKTLKFN